MCSAAVGANTVNIVVTDGGDCFGVGIAAICAGKGLYAGFFAGSRSGDDALVVAVTCCGNGAVNIDIAAQRTGMCGIAVRCTGRRGHDIGVDMLAGTFQNGSIIDRTRCCCNIKGDRLNGCCGRCIATEYLAGIVIAQNIARVCALRCQCCRAVGAYRDGIGGVIAQSRLCPQIVA